MKKLAAVLIVSLALTASTSVPEADAHIFDGLSYIYCQAHISQPGEVLLHSWPYLLFPGSVVYNCIQTGLFTRFRYFVVVDFETGYHWRWGPYDNCNIVYCSYHGIEP